MPGFRTYQCHLWSGVGRGPPPSNPSCCHLGAPWPAGGVWFVGCEGGCSRAVCTWELCVLESRSGGSLWQVFSSPCPERLLRKWRWTSKYRQCWVRLGCVCLGQQCGIWDVCVVCAHVCVHVCALVCAHAGGVCVHTCVCVPDRQRWRAGWSPSWEPPITPPFHLVSWPQAKLAGEFCP